jgi:hypothetical protein
VELLEMTWLLAGTTAALVPDMLRLISPSLACLLTACLSVGCLEPVPDSGSTPGDAGSTSSDAGSTPSDAGVELVGVGLPSCAPNDGPSWAFMLSSQPLTCANAFGEGFSVELWVADLVPGTYALGSSANGTACLCGVVGDVAQHGTMVVEQVTATEVVGRVDAVFQSGSEAHQRFRVQRCPSARQCG